MNRTTVVVAIGLVFATTLPAVPTQVQAQTSRTFVSGSGADSGSCGRAAPCRSFAYATTQTNAGGEITVLDSAGYGPVTITQSLTITNPGGVEAGITAASGVTAITISAQPSDTVFLKGLTLEGGGIANNGINLISAGRLLVTSCVVSGFGAGTGILLGPNGNATNVSFTIFDTIVTGSGQDGIEIVGLPFEQSSISGTITRVEASGNGGSGVDMSGGNTFATVNVVATDVNSSFNSAGFTINFAGTLYLHRNVATGNGTGVNGINVYGSVKTFQDYLFAGNTNANISGVSLSPASNGLY